MGLLGLSDDVIMDFLLFALIAACSIKFIYYCGRLYYKIWYENRKRKRKEERKKKNNDTQQ